MGHDRDQTRAEVRCPAPVVSITEPMAAVLLNLLSQSKYEFVFSGPEDHKKRLSGNTLANQHRIIKKTCSFHPDAGLHALRHTF